MIVPLNLPQANLKLSKKNEQLFVWCIVRKKTLILTPEEWVRQHVIHFLINQKNVPLGLISSELGIQINQLNRRCDVVIFGKDQSAKLLVECKAPEVKLNQNTLQQIAHYNATLNVDYLWITNGIEHALYFIDRNNNQIQILNELPNFDNL
jgi:hypothetical protein